MTTTKLTAEERAACETVERLLRGLEVDEMRLARAEWLNPRTGQRANLTVQCRDPHGQLSGHHTCHGMGLADAIERARAARSTP